MQLLGVARRHDYVAEMGREARSQGSRRACGNGLSVLRIFPLWPDFQPLTAQCGGGGEFRAWAQNDGPLQNPECVDLEMVRRFRSCCDMAEARGLRLVVGILTGWMSGRMFVPPALERRELLTDPAARMWEVRFVRR